MVDASVVLTLIFLAGEKAIGKAGEKVAEAVFIPVWEALEEKARWLTASDETARRWEAFSKAFEEAKGPYLKETPNPEVARLLVGMLEKFDAYPKAERGWLIPLSDELEKLSLVTDKPDLDALNRLFTAAFQRQGIPAPSLAELSEAVRDFVREFQERMFAQPVYRELMRDEAIWRKLRQPRYDTVERYLAQLVNLHQDLDFVGIPELKDRQAVRIEEVFIHLQAEVEVAQVETQFPEIRQDHLPPKDIGPHVTLSDRAIKRRLSVNEALRENPRLVILGDPGAGKTTLLKYIAVAFAQGQSSRLRLSEERLPIFVRLYDYIARRPERSERGFSLVDYLYVQARENLCLDLEPGFFERRLEHGECCVCLDGLDELGSAGLRHEATNAVAALASRYSRNRYLVSSRIVGYAEAPLNRRDFAHHTILPFSDEDIELFVQKWYTARERDPVAARQRAEHLTKTIMGEPRIKSLATNPLMLTIIALVHRIEAELPHERVKLYDKCVTALVDTWEKVKGLLVEDRHRPYYRLRRRLLEQLAYWMHIQPGTSGRAYEVKEGDLELLLKQFLLGNPKLQLDDEGARQEGHDFIALAKSRTGLLVERGEGIYAFAHLTFQEYLAACDIEHRLAHSIDAIWQEIQPRLHNPHWREVILLLLGSLNKFEQHPTELVQRIYASTDNYEDVLHRHLFLASHTLADRVEVEASLHNTIVDGLLAIVRSDELAQGDALDALGALQGDERAAQGLLALARDAQVDNEVRYVAAAALGRLGRTNDEALSGLLSLARDQKTDEHVRSAGYTSLKTLLGGGS